MKINWVAVAIGGIMVGALINNIWGPTEAAAPAAKPVVDPWQGGEIRMMGQYSLPDGSSVSAFRIPAWPFDKQCILYASKDAKTFSCDQDFPVSGPLPPPS